MRVTARLRLRLVVLWPLALGCGGELEVAARDAAADGALPSPGDAPVGGLDAAAPDGLGDDDLPFAQRRANCEFGPGATAPDTFGPSIASADIPIDTFVIIAQENRSFDHYFSRLPEFGQPDVDVASPTASNPDGAGGQGQRFHQAQYCFGDTHHGWDAMHLDYHDGANDGFITTNNPGGVRALGYYDEHDLPFYYALAGTFGIGDHYFSPVLSSTGPNRLYLYAATSAGIITNTGTPATLRTLFDELLDAQVSWKVYSASAYSFEEAMNPRLIRDHPGNFKLLTDYAADAAAGQLPHVVFLYPGSDEHPPKDMQQGQRDVAAVYRTLAQSPQWMRSAFLLTYDEDGGLYDHVPPPPACRPDGIAPMRSATNQPGDFDRLGFRVPLLVASAWSRPHFVSHVVHDHTAILRTLEVRFGLGALTKRDANASTLLEFFDFSAPSFAQPPELPAATVDPAHLCP